MKKVIRIFLLVGGIFALGGCSKEVVTDVSSLNYLDSSSKENIAYNLSLASKELKSASFTGSIIFKEKQYSFKGEVIIGESIDDSIVHINYKDNNFYLKNGNIYLSYMYNNTNVIIKDSIENYTKEIVSLLEFKGINCNEDKINKVLMTLGIEDINFDKVSEYVQEADGGYLVEYKNTQTYFNDNYLPVSFNYQNGDLEIKCAFQYRSIAISVPLGYDLVDMKISTIKDLLKVKNISELIK